MAYQLGPVRKQTAEVANAVGGRFGIKTIWGFGSGSVPGSDHPKGLALDFMTNNLKNGKTVGDAIAEYLIANQAAIGVKYIIWWRRQWSPESGWQPYTGTKNPHTDHVHLSLTGQGQGTGTGGDAFVPAGNPLVPDSIEQLVVVFQDINAALGWISNADNWKRIGVFSGGAALVFFALVGLPGAKVATHLVGKVAK
jgi:hypothetical protein